MSTNYHTAIATGAAANASTINSPLGALDAAIVALHNEIDALILVGGNVATLTAGAASAAQKIVTVDDTTGFLAGGRVGYPLVGGTIEYNTIDTIDSSTQITLSANIGTGGIYDNTYFTMISESEYQRSIAVDFTGYAFVDSAGSDANGRIGRSDKPFASIDAALDALAAYDYAVIRIGIGSFGPVTTAKLRSGLMLIGSGRPSINSSHTALENGTIIQGALCFGDMGNICVANLGVDSGSAVCTALYSGVAQEGLLFYNVGKTAGESPHANIIVNNVIAICKNSSAAVHAALFENVTRAHISNLETWYGTHGVVIKATFSTFANVVAHGHDGEGLIVISNSYANSHNNVISNVILTYADTPGDGGGVRFDTANAGSTAIYDIVIAGLICNGTSYGLKFVATYAAHGSIQISAYQVNALAGSALTYSGSVVRESIFVNGGPLNGIAPTMLNSWSNLGLGYDTARYSKSGQVVHLSGMIKNGNPGTTMFTLPVGYRPVATMFRFVARSDSGVVSGDIIRIDTNGDVTHLSVTKVTDWISLACSFPVNDL